DLARVVLVREPVDDRHPGVLREALDDGLLEGPDHDDVDHAGDDPGDVLDRLAAAHLRVARHERDDRAAELVHARLERHARARGVLLEDHGERAVPQRLVGHVALEHVLDPARALEEVLVLLEREILELEIVPDGHAQRSVAAAAQAGCSAGCDAPWRSRKRVMSGTSVSSSTPASSALKLRGGSSRTTLSRSE